MPKLSSPPLTNPPEAKGDRSLLAWAVASLWILIGLLLASTEICDQDFGLHVSWGRRLIEDFWAAREETLGQSDSLRAYAYSYWLYQVTLARLFDGLGAVGPWILRVLSVSLLFATSFAAARRLGARWSALAVVTAPVIWIASERFVDRPDVLSQVFWLGIFYVLLRLRSDGRWIVPLVAIEVLWANTHVFFPLGIVLVLAFALEEILAGRSRRRWTIALVATVIATFLTPIGPFVWRSQLEMILLVFGSSGPGIQITELQSPYAAQKEFFGLWVFRIVFPLATILVIWRARRLGLAVVLSYAAAAALGLLALRGMSFFALTACAIVPAVLPRQGERTWAVPVLVLWGALALCTLVGLQNGRIYVALDKDLSIGYFGPTRFPTAGAADWAVASGVQGPWFHLPVAAGNLLLRFDRNFEPFLDARWAGTPERSESYLALRNASEETASGLWSQAVGRHGFEAAVLDPYECPALLRALARDPKWSLAFFDGSASVFLRLDGPNETLARTAAVEIETSWPQDDPERMRELSDLAARIVPQRSPPFWQRVHFDFESFGRANFGLQLQDGPLVREEYRVMLRNDKGGFAASPKRKELLGNLLWAMTGIEPKHGLAAVAEAIYRDRSFDSPTRWLAGMRLADAWTAPGREGDLEPLLLDLLRIPLNGAEQRAWLYRHQAALFVRTGRNEEAVPALESALAETPTPELYRGLALLLDQRLERPGEALPYYRSYIEAGGSDPDMEARWHELSGSAEPHGR